ncbi:MAG: hypothetical protein DRN33_00360 [Thermoplasmata archaeon]|nr:MAG: hypothetical protein FE043_03585 [Thermoplasmata archaeon]RLF65058.1 MAG: hypothetical protein DRN33_00360 [Thermoplasmata archaeon]
MKIGRLLCMIVPLMLLLPSFSGSAEEQSVNSQVMITISGGFGITITITILEGENVSEIEWSVKLIGTVFFGIYVEGVINPPVNETTVRIMPFGIGPGILIINVGNSSVSASIFMAGPFVILL